MKKLLTVISGMLLFACLTTGFTTPAITNVTTNNNVSKETKSGTAPRFYRSQWQRTTWVNPWVKGNSAQKKMFADPTIYLATDFFWFPDVYICRLISTTNGTIFDKQDDTQINTSVPAGSYLDLEMQVNPNGGNFIIDIEDEHLGESTKTIFYQDEGTYANFSWKL